MDLADHFDAAYYLVGPTVTELLERLLDKQAGDFLDVIG